MYSILDDDTQIASAATAAAVRQQISIYQMTQYTFRLVRKRFQNVAVFKFKPITFSSIDFLVFSYSQLLFRP